MPAATPRPARAQSSCPGGPTIIENRTLSTNEALTTVTHRVVSGRARGAIAPNFFENDWDNYSDGVGGAIDATQFAALFTADEVAYLSSLTGLAAGVTHYIDLHDRVHQTAGFADHSVETGRQEDIVGVLDEFLDDCTILRTIFIETTIFIDDHVYTRIADVYDRVETRRWPVCHRTGSATHPWQRILVPVGALPAHIKHGDFLVTPWCPCPPPSGDDDGEHGYRYHGGWLNRGGR